MYTVLIAGNPVVFAKDAETNSRITEELATALLDIMSPESGSAKRSGEITRKYLAGFAPKIPANVLITAGNKERTLTACIADWVELSKVAGKFVRVVLNPKARTPADAPDVLAAIAGFTYKA